MQQDVYKLLRSMYESGNMGWYSSRQINKLYNSAYLDNPINLASMNRNLKKLSKDRFIDRVCVNGCFLYRFRVPNKNILFLSRHVSSKRL